MDRIIDRYVAPGWPSAAFGAFAREVEVLAATLPSEVVIQAATRVDLYLRR
jgi:hypothetical protein